MPKILPIQTSFAAGEITPDLYGQITSEEYRQGLALCQNAVTSRHGKVGSRGGSRYVEIDYPPGIANLFAMRINDWLTYRCVILSANDLYFYDDFGGMSSTEAAKTLNTNPRFYSQGTGWASNINGGSSVSFEMGVCKMLFGNEDDAEVGIYSTAITVVDATGYYVSGAFSKKSSNISYRVMVGTTEGASDLLNEYTTTPIFSYSFTSSGTTAYMQIEGYDLESGDSLYLKQFHMTSSVLSASSTTHPWASIEIPKLQAVQLPGTYKLWVVSGTTAIQEIEYVPSTLTWSIGAAALTAAPAAWTGSNYPSAIAIYQGRTWVGGEPDNPERFYGSKSGSYEDFTTGAADGDAFQFDMSNPGKIRWFATARQLLMGTSNGEYIITSDGPIITPSDIDVVQHGSYGCAPVSPISLGTKIIYLDATQKRIRTLKYEWTQESWVSREINFSAEHFGDDGIFESMTFSQSPLNLIFVYNSKGQYYTGTYDKEGEITGWSRHTSEGLIRCIKSIENEGLDEVHIISNKPGGYLQTNFDNSSYFMHYGVYDPDLVLDSMIEFSDLNSALTTVPYADIYVFRFNSDMIAIIDGVEYDLTTWTASTGDMTLPASGNNVKIGKKFSVAITTLPSSRIMDSLNASAAHKKMWNRILLRVVDSDIPVINGVAPKMIDQYTPVSSVSIPYTGDIDIGGLGFDREGQIEITHEDASVINIVGIFGEQSINTPM